MIVFKKNLYLGENAKKEKHKIIRNIRRHKLQFGVYVIALCVNGRDMFDLIPTYMLGTDGYKGRDITILGLAKGKEEAGEVACRMIEDAMSAQTEIHELGTKIRRYFE